MARTSLIRLAGEESSSREGPSCSGAVPPHSTARYLPRPQPSTSDARPTANLCTKILDFGGFDSAKS